MWGYVSFIDLGWLNYGARNVGEYKLDSVAEKVFFLCPSSSSHDLGRLF
jgi:hypothetical protein